MLQQALLDMLAKHAIELVVDSGSPGFYTRLFLVPKKTGDLCPVIDVSALNKFIECPTFKMDTQELVRAFLQPGMLTTPIDLNDAYFHILFHPRAEKAIPVLSFILWANNGPHTTHSRYRLDCQSAKVRTHTLSEVRFSV
jgi:hypothetical protein